MPAATVLLSVSKYDWSTIVGWQKYNTEKGRIGESWVCDYLKRNGYSILERNFRVPGSELDIIALDKACTTLVCIEVKR